MIRTYISMTGYGGGKEDHIQPDRGLAHARHSKRIVSRYNVLTIK